MSWFSGSEQVYVSSVVYNLAGDIDKRPNFLKTTVVGAVLGDVPSIPESISDAYMHGPGLRLKRFARWARTGTFDTDLGMVDGVISSSSGINLSVLAGQIPPVTGASGTLTVQSARFGVADYSIWADQFVAANHPDKIAAGYTSTLSKIPTGIGGAFTWQIDITYADASTDTFTPADFTDSGSYIYASYIYESTSGSTSSWTTPLIFIYRRNNGNATLDAFWNSNSSMGTFFPFIPFRIDNTKVDDLFPTTIYPESKKAFRKATGGSYDKIMSKIEDNPSIGDIDYAYAVFGVSLNTKDQSAKKYIYRFFKAIAEDPNQTSAADYDTYVSEWQDAYDSWQAWADWKNNNTALETWNGNSGDMPIPTDDPEPQTLPFPSMPGSSLAVTSGNNPVMDYNMTISWRYILQDSGTGMINPTGHKNEVWIENAATVSYEAPVWVRDSLGRYVPIFPAGTSVPAITIYYQQDDTHWFSITVAGLVHKNLIYRGNAVTIDCLQALSDANESGFIIPLHEDIYKSLSIKDYTQMATACCYLVFNCYEVVKTHWYQTGWFQIILIVAVIVISVLLFSPETIGAMHGLLGANAAVGASLGITAGTTLAVIVGAIANALAAMILTMVVLKAATAALGSELGGIIAAIVSLAVMQVSQGLQSGKSLTSIFHELMSADNLIKISNSVGNGISDLFKNKAEETFKELAKYQEQNTAQIQSIEQKAAAEFGYDHGVIDPLMFTESGATQKTDFITEPLEVFLRRTLMTGSDIAELSMSMISDFTKLTLTTELV